MTPEEAIGILKNNYPKTCRMVNGRYQGGFDNIECDFGQALTVAIFTLKEIQQYRQIGTVKECREAVEKQKAKETIRIAGRYPYKCPTCNKKLDIGYRRCIVCGQLLKYTYENLEEMEYERD